MFAFAAETVRFNSYSVQHLNISGFAAVQVSPAFERATKKNTRTVQDPSMLIIGKNGLTVKARNKANTVKVGAGAKRVMFIAHDGTTQTFDLV